MTIDDEAEKTSTTSTGIPRVPPWFFIRIETAIASGEAAIEIFSRQDLDRGFATRKKNPLVPRVALEIQ